MEASRRADARGRALLRCGGRLGLRPAVRHHLHPAQVEGRSAAVAFDPPADWPGRYEGVEVIAEVEKFKEHDVAGPFPVSVDSVGLTPETNSQAGTPHGSC